MRVRPHLIARQAFGVGLSLTALLCCAPLPAWSADAPASQPPESAPGPDPKIVTLVGKLAQARDRAQAQSLAAQLEAVREQSVQPAARLLLRRAQREMTAGQRRAAVSDLDDALALQPDNAVLWRERASAHDLDGDLEAAVQDLGGSLSRDASDVLTWQALSAVEEQRGNANAAWKAWQHVLTLDPAIEDGAHRLDRLRRKALGQPA